MDASAYFSLIREWIIHDLGKALDMLIKVLPQGPHFDEAMLLSARFEEIRRQSREGTLSNEAENLEKNKIRAALPQLLQGIGQDMERDTSFGQEVSHAISNLPAQERPPKPPPPAQYDYTKTLIRTFVEAMQPYNDKAIRLCQDFSWLEQAEPRRKVQQFVFQNFVGEIGKQLRKLVNIGEDVQMDPALKARHYVDKCLEIARCSFDLLNYTLLSVWWDAVRSKPRVPEPAEQQRLSAFFESAFEQGLDAKFRLLQTLCAMFGRHELSFPFADAPERLQPQLTDDSPLQRACLALEMAVKVANVQVSENQLADIMQHFAFLTRYRMVSLKKISYRQMRNGRPEYLHRYVALGIDVKFSEDAEKGRWVNIGEQSPAVLLFQGDDYQNGINLFPFVIDYNALSFEQGARICFFSARNLSDEGALDYRFLGDNSILRIEKRGVNTPQSRLDELMMEPKLLSAFNLDCVVDGFHEARQAIAGAQADFFDTL